MPIYDDEEAAARTNRAGTDVVGDDFERASEGIPVWGDATGANDKMAELRRERSQQQALDYLRNPALEDARPEHMLGESKAAEARARNRTLRSQMSALQQLEGASAPRYGAGDRAQTERRRNADAAALTAARRQAAASGQSSGLTGGGQLAAAMGAADVQGIGRAGDVGAQNADVQMRALDALSGAGELGSTMRRQYADETFARAGAEDAARRFDLDYVRDVHQRNADRRIRSKEAEAGVVTGIADQAAAQAAADQAAEDEQIMGLLSLAAMA